MSPLGDVGKRDGVRDPPHGSFTGGCVITTAHRGMSVPHHEKRFSGSFFLVNRIFYPNPGGVAMAAVVFGRELTKYQYTGVVNPV